MVEAAQMQEKLEQGLALFAEGRHGEAYEAVLAVAEASPGSARLWDLLGTIALEGDRPWHAYQAFTRRRVVEDDEESLMNQLAAAYYAVELETFRKHVEEAKSLYPESPEAKVWAAKSESLTDGRSMLIDVGRALCREQRYADAVELFVAAMEVEDAADARLWLGRAFLAMDDFENAAGLLESAARALPDDPSIAVDTAAAFVGGGRKDIARAWLEGALELHPDSPDVLEALARLSLEEGDGAAAVSAAGRALRIDTMRAGSWLALAGGRELTGDVMGARIAADRSIAMKPETVMAWGLAARLVQAGGDAGLAERYRAAAAALAGSDGGDTEAQPGPLKDEIDTLYAYITQNPTETATYRDRAAVYRMLDLRDRALYYLDLVERDLPHDPEALAAERLALKGEPQPTAAPATPEAAERAAFCTKCGSPFAGDADFCTKCGTRRI